MLYLIATGKAGVEISGFASNGYGEFSPGQDSIPAVLICEVVLTVVFLLVIFGSTAKRAQGGFAGISIGLCSGRHKRSSRGHLSSRWPLYVARLAIEDERGEPYPLDISLSLRT